MYIPIRSFIYELFGLDDSVAEASHHDVVGDGLKEASRRTWTAPHSDKERVAFSEPESKAW